MITYIHLSGLSSTITAQDIAQFFGDEFGRITVRFMGKRASNGDVAASVSFEGSHNFHSIVERVGKNPQIEDNRVANIKPWTGYRWLTRDEANCEDQELPELSRNKSPPPFRVLYKDCTSSLKHLKKKLANYHHDAYSDDEKSVAHLQKIVKRQNEIIENQQKTIKELTGSMAQ